MEIDLIMSYLPSRIPQGSNPSAQIGLTPVNGSAGSFLRSDGAPSLDTTITPTLSGLWIFGAGAKRTAGTSSTNAGLGGVIFDHFADVGNTTTTETDLYSDTIAANMLDTNGAKLGAAYGLTLVSSATATRQVRVYFAGTVIFDSTALTTTSTGAMDLRVFIIRDTSTTIRYIVRADVTGLTSATYLSVGKLTGLTLTGTNILKITGQAGGTGAATNDIVAIAGSGEFQPAF